MAFTILPLTPTDIPFAVEIYLSSFATNAHSLACFPRSSPDVRGWWEDMLRSELDEEGAVWLKAIEPATGEMVCFAKWVRVPPGKTDSEEANLPTTWPEGADERVCHETFGVWAERKKEIMAGRGHWYLEIIATSPTYQGRGAASQIISWGVEKADDERVECYLEASPDAVRLYEKFGFGEVGRTETWIESAKGEGKGKEREGMGVWYVNLFMVRPGKGRT